MGTQRLGFLRSLRHALTIPYVILILALALTIAGLSYLAGSQAVDSVTRPLLVETLGRIAQAVDRHIMGSAAVLEAAFPDGMPVSKLTPSDIEPLRTRFWIATSLHTNPNNYVYFGNKEGQAIGLFRRSRDEGELRIKLQADQMREYFRFKGIDGALAPHSREEKLFDPRTRPWYKAGQAEADQTWTSVYIDFGTGELVATRARKVLDREGLFAGVVATDVSLKTLNDFVSGLKVSKNGVALIIEPNGELIASSITKNIHVKGDDSKERLNAGKTGNQLVSVLYAQVQRRLLDKQFQGPQTFLVDVPNAEPVYAAFDRVTDNSGLSWITVVAMPRSDFMGDVMANLLRTIGLALLAMLLTIALGLRILSWVTGDLKRFSDSVFQMRRGELGTQLGKNRFSEIGELATSFQTMQQRLLTDELTGLANREAFTLRVNNKLGLVVSSDSTKHFALLFIDLNNFKQVNDLFGHGVGDQVLIEIGKRLHNMMAPSDLVARISGDEFAIYIDEVEGEPALSLIRQNISMALKKPLTCLEHQIVTHLDFGGSVGSSIYPQDGLNISELLKKADRRMYRQKFASANSALGNLHRRASDDDD